MKVHDILEGKVTDAATIISRAEKRAYDESAKSKSNVSGDTILKYAIENAKNMNLPPENEAEMIRVVTDRITASQQQ